MKTYQITLPDEFAAFVDQALTDGKWDTVDHLVMYGLLRAEDDIRQDQEMDQTALRKAVQIGIDQADRGEVIEGPIVMDRLREKLRAARKQPT